MGRYMIEWSTRLGPDEDADEVGEAVSDALDFGCGHGLPESSESVLAGCWPMVTSLDDVGAYLSGVAKEVGRAIRFEVTCLDGLKTEIHEVGA